VNDQFSFGWNQNPHEARFWEFHNENPHVYALFDRFANEAVRAHRPRFSAYMIFERMRWYSLIETSDEKYKLNNNHRPYYARLWLKRNPQHAHLFETRTLLSGPESEALRVHDS
jgi:hypothetical protein